MGRVRGAMPFIASFLAVLVVSVPIMVLASPVPASQASYAPCSGTKASKFDGTTNDPGAATFGVRADIEYRAASLCGSNGVFSVTWAMVTAHNSHTGGEGWVQTGYGNFDNSYSGHQGEWIWGQSNKGCTGPNQETQCPDVKNAWGPPSDGSTHTYAARYYASDGFGHMVYDGHEIGVTTWDMTNQWDTNWQGQFFGETKYLSSDVSGIPPDHTSFTKLQRLKFPNGTQNPPVWSDITALNALDSYNCRYKHAWITQNASFNIWTDPLLDDNC